MIFVVFTHADNGTRFAIRCADILTILDGSDGTELVMKDNQSYPLRFIVKEPFEEVVKKCNPPESLFSSYCCCDTDEKEHK